VDAAAAAASFYEAGPLPPLAIDLGRALYLQGKLDEATQVLERAISTLAAPESDLGRRLEAELIATLEEAGRSDDADLRIAALDRSRLEDDVGTRMLLAHVASRIAHRNGSRAEALELARLALAGGALATDEHAHQALLTAAGVLAVAGELDEAEAVLGDAITVARATGSVGLLGAATASRARIFFFRGELAQAEAESRTALETVDAAELAQARPWTAAFLAETLVERGELDDAERMLTATASTITHFLHARARLRIAQGRPEAALADLDILRRRDTANPATSPWRGTAAEAFLALGRADDARAMASEELQAARRWGSAREVGRALRMLGSDDDLRESVDVLDSSSARLELLYSLTALGAAVRRRGRRMEARTVLARAVALADECGATLIGRRARSELIAAGARPRRTSMSGVRSLTASELRVAELAANGHSNREIAQILFVTQKTVEMHLSRSYRKLRIGSRVQLSAALHG
jgi:ATP/maltotriose-dependent transcriptional regulator MalT